MFTNLLSGSRGMLLAGFLASSILVLTAVAQSPQENGNSSGAPPPASVPSPTHKTSPYRPSGVPPHARAFYQLAYGVDSFSARSVESGELIRFSYHVIDAEKAKALNDKKNTPSLIDEKARVKLIVPTMEKVGQLRQTSPPESGKAYWMVFSNKGNLVKRGDRVNVVIGKFLIDGLVVQ